MGFQERLAGESFKLGKDFAVAKFSYNLIICYYSLIIFLITQNLVRNLQLQTTPQIWLKLNLFDKPTVKYTALKWY